MSILEKANKVLRRPWTYREASHEVKRMLHTHAATLAVQDMLEREKRKDKVWVSTGKILGAISPMQQKMLNELTNLKEE